MIVYLLENKKDVLKYFKIYSKMVEAKFNNNFKEYCQQEGIQIETTIVYSPQQNGKAERLNRTLVEKARKNICQNRNFITITNTQKIAYNEI